MEILERLGQGSPEALRGRLATRQYALSMLRGHTRSLGRKRAQIMAEIAAIRAGIKKGA